MFFSISGSLPSQPAVALSVVALLQRGHQQTHLFFLLLFSFSSLFQPLSWSPTPSCLVCSSVLIVAAEFQGTVLRECQRKGRIGHRAAESGLCASQTARSSNKPTAYLLSKASLRVCNAYCKSRTGSNPC